MLNTLCLHDKGEENWKVKLHLGCGGVYLTDSGTGYTNIDIDGLDARTNPVMVQANNANISDYYAGLDGDVHHLPRRRMTVVDLQTDVTELPYTARSVDKIVAVQVFEHLSPVRAMDALYHWRRILKDGKPLVMSVPDMLGVLDMMDEANRINLDRGIADLGFSLRHLRGRANGGYHVHRAWYTHETLRELLEFCGFEPTALENFHFYPALVYRAIKR